MEHRDDEWPLPLWTYLAAAAILGLVPWPIGWAIGWFFHEGWPLLARLF
ncbi:MAG: hypothetical protein KDK11_14720 [Maritimibacter sp.]|nr:hypothetical protein [Maritimibacter sp.]